MTSSYEIEFGTDGWRGVIARDFTVENVARVSRSLARHLKHSSEGAAAPLVVVGYDARFMSPHFAHTAAAAIRAEGLDVKLSREELPTPALSWAVRQQQADAGVMITASHNPAEWNGIKLKGAYGGTALPDFTAAVEKQLASDLASEQPPHIPELLELLTLNPPEGVEVIDPLPAYLEQVQSLSDMTPEMVSSFYQRLKAAGSWSGERPVIVADAMFGAAAGLFQRVLEPYGFEVVELHAEKNPGFGGTKPEPIAPNLEALQKEVCRGQAVMGFATDGDGDRIGAVDERGRFIDAQHIFALLLELLAAEKEWTGLVVKTFAVTDLVDRLAEAHGLPVKRTPVGFKYVCELALERTMLIGGEESGGIGVKNHIPERDGLLCALFLAEIAVRRQQPLSVLVEHLHETYGIHTYRRVDLELEPAVKNRLMNRLEADPPQSFAGREVAEIDSLDGFRFELAGGGWILMRPSGTEPVVRLYAEAGGRGELEELLGSAQAFVNEAAHG